MYIDTYIFFDEKCKGSAYFSALDIDFELELMTALWVFTIIDCMGQLPRIRFHEGNSVVAERDKSLKIFTHLATYSPIINDVIHYAYSIVPHLFLIRYFISLIK